MSSAAMPFPRRISFAADRAAGAWIESGPSPRRSGFGRAGGLPPPTLWVQVRARDSFGHYAVPFPCRFTAGAWCNAASGDVLTVTVTGWRQFGGAKAPRAAEGGSGYARP